MSKNKDSKTAPGDPQAAAAALPERTKAANALPDDPDQHYKIKKMSYHPESEAAEALLATAVKLDNAVLRVVNRMLALGRGQSKHAYKKTHKGKPDKEVTYSESTALGQYQIMHAFIGWALNSGRLREGMKLADLEPLIQPYLDEKRKGCAADTVHTYASQICKTMGLNMEDYQYPPRCRAGTVAHRGGLADFCEMAKKYPMLISFCLATGFRKYKELARIYGTDYHEAQDGAAITVVGKGGLLRDAPVVGDAEAAELVARLCREAGEKRVFPRLPANADLHVHRAMYACQIYLMHARDINTLERREKYVCRKDYKGIVLDRAALEIVSKALGHARIWVIAKSYMWPLEPFLRGGILASPLPQAKQNIE